MSDFEAKIKSVNSVSGEKLHDFDFVAAYLCKILRTARQRISEVLQKSHNLVSLA